MSIRDVKPDEFAQWNVLWQAYLKFYKTELSDDVTKATWGRFFDEKSSFTCHVVDNEGKLVGFAISAVHSSSWSQQDSCYLEDLYVSEDARGKGAGQSLIQHLIDQSAKNNWARVYWHTDTDNDVARKLYDGFKPADDVVRYKIDVND